VLSEYLLLDLITGKQKPYHISDLKPFVFDLLNVDPLDIARRGYLAFFIEKILAMSGDIKKVSTLDFHVKWLGYDELAPLENLICGSLGRISVRLTSSTRIVTYNFNCEGECGLIPYRHVRY
jgi:hypothetical protein